MSLLKIPLICSDAVGMRITGRPPRPPPGDHDPRATSGPFIPNWREVFLRSLSWPCVLLRAMSWGAGAIEMLVIIAAYDPTGPLSRFILQYMTLSDTCPSRLRVTTPFIVGNILTLLGTMLRLQCYHTLGHMFTFDLSIKHNHHLVTNGPYSFVRHPSYTGMILTILGAVCSQWKGSWVAECGILNYSIGIALVIYWVLISLSVIISLLLRLPNEDDLLKKEFGSQWTQWAKDVPYKLIPQVY